MKIRFLLSLASLVIGFTGTAESTPFQWTISSGGNGHWYELVADNSVNWQEARVAAESSTYNDMNGYLATITFEAENQMIADFILPGIGYGYIIGGTDELTEETWQWLSGEEWNYTNWHHPSQPDNHWGNALGHENHLEIMDFGRNNSRFGKWNDIVEIRDRSGYIIEYNPDNPVPESTTMLLFGTGIAILVGAKIRKKRKG